MRYLHIPFKVPYHENGALFWWRLFCQFRILDSCDLPFADAEKKIVLWKYQQDMQVRNVSVLIIFVFFVFFSQEC